MAWLLALLLLYLLPFASFHFSLCVLFPGLQLLLGLPRALAAGVHLRPQPGSAWLFMAAPLSVLTRRGPGCRVHPVSHVALTCSIQKDRAVAESSGHRAPFLSPSVLCPFFKVGIWMEPLPILGQLPVPLHLALGLRQACG